MNNALVVGCSYANGHGLDSSQAGLIWPTTLLNSLGIQDIDNLSKSGSNNQYIFTEAACALTKKDYSVAIIAWSETSRFNVNFGLEPYSTLSRLVPEYDINLHNNQTVTKKFQKDIGDNLRKHLNYHWYLLDLVKYVNILSSIKPKNLFFVNSLGVWSDNFFERKTFSTPSELTAFEQDLLDCEYRSDPQIIELYNYIHDQYQHYGGIKSSQWLNLYQSLRSMRVDTASEFDPHPGIKSQGIFKEYLLSRMVIT